MSVLAVAVALAAQGCSDSVAPVPPGLVAGKWALDFSIPGSFLEMTLVATGTEVTGSANGCGEAGPCSTSTIGGKSDETGVHLNFVTTVTVPQPGGQFMSNFDGKLVNANTLKGILVDAGRVEVGTAPSVLVFHRE
ncbi:MAG TPA: hypothetical protein VGN73_00135 [Gemmatimonadaceae bacterium]|nr:hypothetical protein [Gemmatimonadaceae bacterium]